MHPTARRADVIVQDVEGETLVDDQLRDAAHSLDAVAAFVFKKADGATWVAELTSLMGAELQMPSDERTTEAALRKLDRVHLLEAALPLPSAPRTLSRREALQHIGVAALALPVSTSIVTPTPTPTPTPAAAQSGRPGTGGSPRGKSNGKSSGKSKSQGAKKGKKKK